MIFGKEYDVALSIILKCDKKNNVEIIDNLSEIPEELIKKIICACNILKEKETFSNMNVDEKNMMSGLMDTNNGVYFSFEIDEYDLSLCIKKYEKSSILYVDSFIYELRLNRIDNFRNVYLNRDIASYERGFTVVSEGRLKKGIVVHKIISDVNGYCLKKSIFDGDKCSLVYNKNNKRKGIIGSVNLERMLCMQEALCTDNLDKMFLSKYKRRKRVK